MAYAYAITQYNGLDYQNGFQPKWNEWPNEWQKKKRSYVKPEELIVNELIKALEDGVPVWRKEWTVKGGFRNLLTGKIIRVQTLHFSVYLLRLGAGIFRYLLEEVKLSRLAAYLKKFRVKICSNYATLTEVF